jgi:hypothetical protein
VEGKAGHCPASNLSSPEQLVDHEWRPLARSQGNRSARSHDKSSIDVYAALALSLKIAFDRIDHQLNISHRMQRIRMDQSGEPAIVINVRVLHRVGRRAPRHSYNSDNGAGHKLRASVDAVEHIRVVDVLLASANFHQPSS